MTPVWTMAAYCDGVEYCQEDVSDFICNSTGDPCDAALTCDEASDVCDVSDVTLTVADTYGYSGTIDIELDNPLDLVGEVHVDVCDRDQRPWLTINTGWLQHHGPQQCLHLCHNKPGWRLCEGRSHQCCFRCD